MRKQVHFSQTSAMSTTTITSIRINCGGQVIEVSKEVFEGYPKSGLYEMTKYLRKDEEIFIDRDPYGLRTIIDYLHCGIRILYSELSSVANAEYLEKEAEVRLKRI